ncbi:MAG: lysylphosphatidylglycerol synthase transmembrane domain-containing protein [Planctomycetota bacterium]
MKRALRWFQPIFGALVLGFVAFNLPWTDQLVVVLGEGDSAIVEGSIDGDWRGQEVRFVPEAEAAQLEAASIDAEPLVLDRAEDGTWVSGERGFDLRPSIQRVFRDVKPWGIGLAFVAMFLALLCGITRWWRLLRLAGCEVRWTDSFRLTYLGLFFNLVVPGLTGGDVIKAILAAKENPGRRADALVSVVVDRVLGLGVLAALATVVILFLGPPFDQVRLGVALVLVAMVGGALSYVNPTLRRLLRFEQVLEALPQSEKLKQLDSAILTYTKHPGEIALALVFSLGNHFFAILGIAVLSIAFGVSTDVIGILDYFALVPVATMVSSLPLAPGGWGVGEAIFAFLYSLMGASAALGVAVSISFRIVQVLLGLAGGLYLLKPGASAELHEAEAEAEAL